MKGIHLISLGLVAILLAACIVVTNAQDQLDGADDSQSIQTARSQFMLPKVFDFELYKKLFHKTYHSLVQELARQKLFLAKAFKAFISGIKYKTGNSDHYSSINQLSDKTPDELARRTNRKLKRGNGSKPVHSGEIVGEHKIEVADRADVERELRRIIENQNSEPGLKGIAEEISKASGLNRRRRHTDRRDVSLEELLLPTAQVAESKKIVNSVPTNNPNYERVELFSFGTDDNSGTTEIPSDKANFINSLPGFQFIDSIREQIGTTMKGNKKIYYGPTGKKENSFKAPLKDVMYTDLRRTNCFFKPRDQGDCGSCYIFTTTTFLEWIHCMKTGKLVAFSEQYQIDCGFPSGLKGCEGGDELDVLKFDSIYGLELNKNYPYKAIDATCPYPRGTDPRVMGYMRIDEPRVRAVRTVEDIEETLKKYPLIVLVNVPPEFSDYGGGVHPGETCNEEDGQHSMLLVGSGRQDGQDYWLLRNSYDDTWGEGGYFKLSKKSACFVVRQSLTTNTMQEIQTPLKYPILFLDRLIQVDSQGDLQLRHVVTKKIHQSIPLLEILIEEERRHTAFGSRTTCCGTRTRTKRWFFMRSGLELEV